MIHHSENSQKGQFPVNEDRLLVKRLSNDSILAVMADGMGGLDHGEIAAEIAARQIVFSLEEKTILNKTDIYQALLLADEAIEQESLRRGMKMGCAIAIVCIQNCQMLFVSLGNIRISSCDEHGTTMESFAKDSSFRDPLGGSYLTDCIRGRGFREAPSVEEVKLPEAFHIRICTDGFYNPDSKDDSSVIDIFRKPD